MSSSTYLLRPIGWVRSTLKRTADVPKQGYEGPSSTSSPGSRAKGWIASARGPA